MIVVVLSILFLSSVLYGQEELITSLESLKDSLETLQQALRNGIDFTQQEKTERPLPPLPTIITPNTGRPLPPIPTKEDRPLPPTPERPLPPLPGEQPTPTPSSTVPVAPPPPPPLEPGKKEDQKPIAKQPDARPKDEKTPSFVVSESKNYGWHGLEANRQRLSYTLGLVQEGFDTQQNPVYNLVAYGPALRSDTQPRDFITQEDGKDIFKFPLNKIDGPVDLATETVITVPPQRSFTLIDNKKKMEQEQLSQREYKEHYNHLITTSNHLKSHLRSIKNLFEDIDRNLISDDQYKSTAPIIEIVERNLPIFKTHNDISQLIMQLKLISQTITSEALKETLRKNLYEIQLLINNIPCPSIMTKLAKMPPGMSRWNQAVAHIKNLCSQLAHYEQDIKEIGSGLSITQNVIHPLIEQQYSLLKRKLATNVSSLEDIFKKANIPILESPTPENDDDEEWEA